jgi:hypothetical protein
MRFQDFAKYLEALENMSGRIEMYWLLAGSNGAISAQMSSGTILLVGT